MAANRWFQVAIWHSNVALDRVPGIEGLAVQVRIASTEERAGEIVIGGRYRLDFGPDEPRM
jgi:hypothetical protein